MRRLCLAWLLLLSAICLGAAGKGSGVVQALTCDLEGDGAEERVVLDSRRAETLSVWRGKVRLWQGVPGRWKPWKLVVADVDGDGRKEILLGVHKATRYFPEPHNCLFVYGWDGRQAFPRWLGSRLSKPFVDFALADVDEDGRDEVLSVEVTRDKRRCLLSYSWCGFGFTVDWQRGPWEDVSFTRAEGGRLTVRADGEPILTVAPAGRCGESGEP
jgi:hypothetical protein